MTLSKTKVSFSFFFKHRSARPAFELTLCRRDWRSRKLKFRRFRRRSRIQSDGGEISSRLAKRSEGENFGKRGKGECLSASCFFFFFFNYVCLRSSTMTGASHEWLFARTRARSPIFFFAKLLARERGKASRGWELPVRKVLMIFFAFGGHCFRCWSDLKISRLKEGNWSRLIECLELLTFLGLVVDCWTRRSFTDSFNG